MKMLINNFLARHFKLSFIRTNSQRQIQVVEANDWDIDTIKICSEISMQSQERLWALINATKYIIQRNIPGDFVECGVWKGASAVAISRTLKSLGITNRNIYLFDTFEGMTQPTEIDMRISDAVSASEILQKTQLGDGDNVWAHATVTSVQGILDLQDYPADRFKIVKGDVLETLQSVPLSEISLLRLDTDWYESTKFELEVLFPKVAENGILIIDDFGHWEGSRRAVVEFFNSLEKHYLLGMVDYTGRILIKN